MKQTISALLYHEAKMCARTDIFAKPSMTQGMRKHPEGSCPKTCHRQGFLRILYRKFGIMSIYFGTKCTVILLYASKIPNSIIKMFYGIPNNPSFRNILFSCLYCRYKCDINYDYDICTSALIKIYCQIYLTYFWLIFLTVFQI